MTRAPFHLLLVCTGNVCRSPLGERLLASHLGPAVQVSSAGIEALAGQDMTPQTRAAVLRHGGCPDGFTARQLSPQLIAQSDLVLTATRQQRGEAIMLLPRASTRIFTLREFTRIAGQVRDRLPHSTPAGRLAAAVPLVASRRGFFPQQDPALDDVPDPYGLDEDAYARSAAMTAEAVEDLVAVVVGRPVVAGVR